MLGLHFTVLDYELQSTGLQLTNTTVTKCSFNLQAFVGLVAVSMMVVTTWQAAGCKQKKNAITAKHKKVPEC